MKNIKRGLGIPNILYQYTLRVLRAFVVNQTLGTIDHHEGTKSSKGGLVEGPPGLMMRPRRLAGPRLVHLATCTFAAVTMMASVAGLAVAGIEGSKHDFSNKDWAGGDSCGACHSPHRVEAPKAAPLWEPNANLKKRFGAASGGAAKETSAAPGRGTLLCIRCHDGTVARDTISGVGTDRFVNVQNPGVFGTGHGATDHPVGVEYPKIDRGYRPTENVTAGGAVQLPAGRVECTSCHDPHNQSGFSPMLVMSNSRSALCLTCHRK